MSERHEALLTRHADGVVTVEHADPVIWVTPKLLELAEEWALPAGDDKILQLDTAGQFLYLKVGPAPGGQYLEYGRIVDV